MTFMQNQARRSYDRTPILRQAVRTEVVRKVKSAFLPLRCAVEVKQGTAADAPSTLRLTVMNPGKRALNMPKITLGDLGDEQALDDAIRLARMEMRRRGYA